MVKKHIIIMLVLVLLPVSVQAIRLDDNPVDGNVDLEDGGTGESTAQAAIDALTNVSVATNEHVLTKDTATGNAIFKAASGGGGTPGGSDTQVQYNNSGSFGGDSGMVYDDLTGTLTITGSIIIK